MRGKAEEMKGGVSKKLYLEYVRYNYPSVGISGSSSSEEVSELI